MHIIEKNIREVVLVYIQDNILITVTLMYLHTIELANNLKKNKSWLDRYINM